MKHGETRHCSREEVRRGTLCASSLAKDLSGDRDVISVARAPESRTWEG